MKRQHFIFLNGQGGTGKSSIVHHFLAHPIPGWIFFDYDNGAHPMPKEETDQLAWKQYKTTQLLWWIEVMKAQQEKQECNIVLCGAMPLPWKIDEMDIIKECADSSSIHHAFLYCNDEERKRRLAQRGDTHIWEAHSGSDRELLKKIEDYGSRKFDTSHKSIPEVAQDINSFLTSCT